jgi:thioredoxin 1
MFKRLLLIMLAIGLAAYAYSGTNKTASQSKTEVKKAAQKAKIIQALPKVTFIELGSVNCIPCKAMKKIMDELELEYTNQVKIVFYDVWTEQGKPYADVYKIRVIPTQVFLDKKGKEYFRHEGFFPKEELIDVLKKQGVK